MSGNWLIYLLIAAAFLFIIGLLVKMSSAKGALEQQQRSGKAAKKQREQAHAVDKAVDNLSPSDKRNRLRKRKRK